MGGGGIEGGGLSGGGLAGGWCALLLNTLGHVRLDTVIKNKPRAFHRCQLST